MDPNNRALIAIIVLLAAMLAATVILVSMANTAAHAEPQPTHTVTIKLPGWEPIEVKVQAESREQAIGKVRKAIVIE